MEINDLTTQAGVLTGVFLGAVVSGLIGYFRRKPTAPATSPVITGVGLEFGNRAQMDQLIGAVIRIGDILENKKQAGIEAELKRLVDEIDDMRDDKR